MDYEHPCPCDPLPGQLAIYQGDTLLLTDIDGNLAGGTAGLYFRHTRFLSRLRLRIAEAEVHVVSAHVVRPHALLAYGFAPWPGGAADPRVTGEIANKAIVTEISSFVGNGLHQDVRVTNYAPALAQVTLEWRLAADFADQAEAKSGDRQQDAPIGCDWSGGEGGGELRFSYHHPELQHATVLAINGRATFSAWSGGVRCRFELSAGETLPLRLRVLPVFNGTAVVPSHGSGGVVAPAIAAAKQSWTETCTLLETSSPIVQVAWNRAAADLASLHLLEGDEEERFTPAAGAPNYLGLFGRDALVAGWQAWLLNPRMLRGTLHRLRAWIARDYDDRFDAQPGRVLHQRVQGPLALLGNTPFAHYYGDYSAPALFLLGLAWDLACTGDLGFFRSMHDDALAILAWMRRDGDSDGDGLYEYQTRAGPGGLKNQGWKDSGQAIVHTDGRVVDDPIAVCEIQGLYYAAMQALALAFACDGEHAQSSALLSQAAALKRRFNERFWMPDAGYYALAIGPDGQQVCSVADSPGACLTYGIVDTDKAAAVVKRLMAPDLFSGWGIRTLSSRHPAFNPFAYHLGAVWPFSTATIASGLQRYGAFVALHRLAEAMFAATQLFIGGRLPEVFGGNPRDASHAHPGLYPGACAPQAWSAGAIISLIGSLLGLTPLAPRQVLIVDPQLPEWLPDLTLRRLVVGEACVSLRFHREANGSTACEVLERSGELRLFQPRVISGGDRLAAALREALGLAPGSE